MPLAVHAEMPMGMGGRAHGIAGNADPAVRAVLEPHGHAQAAGHFPMDLRFGGACTNGDPTEQVIEVAGGHGLQQFGGDGQAQLQYFAHQFPGQGQAGRHVIAAIQARIVGQAFPAYGRAGLFYVGAHDQQHAVAHFMGHASQVGGVFEGGFRVVDRAGANDDQQAGVLTVEDRADGLAMGAHLVAQRGAERQLVLELQRARQTQGQGFVGRVERGQRQSGDGRIHDLASWTGSGFIPARRS
ncbi:hypothetical protein D3C78_1259490 [compost metagenome]